MTKLNLKLRYKYILDRVDKISIAIILILTGFYFGGQISLSIFTYILLGISIFLIVVYKRNSIVLGLCLFVLSMCIFTIGISFMKYHSPAIQGDIHMVGANMVLSTYSGLWFHQRFVMENSIYLPKEHVKCSHVEITPITQDSELLAQGIKYKANCLSRWVYYDSDDIFYTLNQTLAQKFDSFSKDQADLLKGITLGIKPSKELSQEFQRIGLSHIIVISGFNITLIITILIKCIFFLPLSVRIILICAFIVIFVLIVGPTPPVIRASIMGIIGYIASTQYKNMSMLRILLSASVIMILLDPYAIYSISFHLSFLATLGVILFCNSVHGLLTRLPAVLGETIGQTLAASITTIPYTTNIFRTFSNAFLLSNVLVLPFLSLLSILAYIYLFFQIPWLYHILSYFSNFMLQITFFLSGNVNSVMALDFGELSDFNLFSVCLIVMIGIIYVFKVQKHFNRIEKNIQIRL